MGFLRRLFGGGDADDKPPADEPAAVHPVAEPRAAALGDPYRGGAAVTDRPRREAVHLTPIWNSRTDVLAIERGDSSDYPLRSVTFTGTKDQLSAIRKVTFVDDGVALDWQIELAYECVSSHQCGRIEDRIIVPHRKSVVAVHPDTGEPCWELPYPSTLHTMPHRLPSGDLLLVFVDQGWVKLAPRDGELREEGRVRSEDEARGLLRAGRPLNPGSEREVYYSGHKISAWDELRVSRDDDPRRRVHPYEPPPPAVGAYPIDEWQADTFIDLVHDKLAVKLSRSWRGRTRIAVGLLEPTSLEPLRLLELSDGGFERGYTVDDLLLFRIQQPQASGSRVDTTFAIDTRNERVLAAMSENADSVLFDDRGRPVWRGRL